MLAAIGDDTWNMLDMQHITPNLDYSIILEHQRTHQYVWRWPPPWTVYVLKKIQTFQCLEPAEQLLNSWFSRFKFNKQGCGKHWTDDMRVRVLEIGTQVVLEYKYFSTFMFIILDRTSTRMVLTPTLSISHKFIPTFQWKCKITHHLYYGNVQKPEVWWADE